jgi:hypothetical protein
MDKITLTENGKAVLAVAPTAFAIELFARGGTIGFVLAGAATFIAARHGSEIKDVSARLLSGLVNRDPTEKEIAAYMRLHQDIDTLSDDDIAAYMQTQGLTDDCDLSTSLDDDIKTFRHLLEAGVIQEALARGELCIGYVENELRFIPIKEVFALGLAGLSKTGKSTTTRFILFQFILIGAKLVMIDPHITEVEESLAGEFINFKNVHAMPPCGDDHKDVEKRIKALFKEYLRRKNAGIKGPVLILVIDELNGLMRRLPSTLKKLLSDLILTIESEARKFGIYCFLIGQRWSENDLGGKPYGAAIRETMSALIVHRVQSEEQASKLLGSQYKAQCLTLPTGHYLFRDSNGGTSEVTTPNTLASDAIRIQQILDQRTNQRENYPEKAQFQEVKTRENTPERSPYETTGNHENKQFQAVSEDGETAETSDMHTLGLKILSMQANGMGKAEIVRELWGVNPGGTDAYKKAQAEYHQVLKFIAEKYAA